MVDEFLERQLQVDRGAGTLGLDIHGRAIGPIRAWVDLTVDGAPQTMDLVRTAELRSGRSNGPAGNAGEVRLTRVQGPVAAELTVAPLPEAAAIEVAARIELTADGVDVRLNGVTLFAAHFRDTFLAPLGFDACRFWRDWHDVWTVVGSLPLRGPADPSDMDQAFAFHAAAVYSPGTGEAVTFAYELPNQWQDTVRLEDALLVAYDQIAVRLVRGQPVHTDRLAISLGPPFTAVLKRLRARHMPRRRAVEAGEHVGWNSWEAYHGQVTAADILENVAAIGAIPWLRDRVRYITVDDGWARAYGDWEPNAKFGEGMDGLARHIRRAGFTPGIWTAPLLAHRDTDLVRRHPELLLRGTDGAPLTRFGEPRCLLDVTHPGTRAFLFELYSRLYTWGYRYFKTDFLRDAIVYGMPGKPGISGLARFHDPDLGAARGMRGCMQAIRAAIGEDSFWLGCGTDIGSGALLMDGSRVGCDIGPYWALVPHQARSVIHHFHLHGTAFLADPDFAIVKSPDTFRPECFDLAPEGAAPFELDRWHSGPCFSADDARAWMSVVVLSGGLVNLSDRIAALNPVGLEIIRTALQYAGGPAAVPLDVGQPVPRVLLREDAARCLLGLYNWQHFERARVETTAAMGVPFPASGVVRDVWTGRAVPVPRGELGVELAPHGCLLVTWARDS